MCGLTALLKGSTKCTNQHEDTAFTNEPNEYPNLELPGVWIGTDDDSVNIGFTPAKIRYFLESTADAQEKGQRMRLVAAFLEYAEPRVNLETTCQRILQKNIETLRSYQPAPFREPLQDHIQTNSSTLLSKVDDALRRTNMIFGPLNQKEEHTKPGNRLICPFCLHLKETVSDIRNHMHKFHARKVDKKNCKHIGYTKEEEDLDNQHITLLTTVEIGRPNRLRVFGQYSYADVQYNNWNIPDWNERAPRKARTSKTSEPGVKSSFGKRKSRDGGHEADTLYKTPSRKSVAASTYSPTIAASSDTEGPVRLTPDLSSCTTRSPGLLPLSPVRHTTASIPIDPRLAKGRFVMQQDELAGFGSLSSLPDAQNRNSSYDHELHLRTDEMSSSPLESPTKPVQHYSTYAEAVKRHRQ